MNKLILSALVLLCTSNLMATDRTTNEMKAIAAQQLLGAGVKAAGKGQALKLTCVQEDPAFAIYTPENNAGFVIVSRDDSVLPVLAYSTTSFDANNVPSDLQWWLERTSKCLETYRAKGRKVPVWESGFEPIAPMMTTKWGQEEYFNTMTPTFSDKHAMTGCVATAMAQVMNYNQWPASANFTGYYFTETPNDPYNPTNYETATVNSTYVWPLPDFFGNYYPDGYAPGTSPSYINPGKTPSKRVATLMRDCGYSVGMQYSPNGSGSQIRDAGYAFVSFFGYPAESVKYRMKNNRFQESAPFYRDREWWQIIANELRCGSPVICGAQDDSGKGGHAFVFHGMDKDGRVYVNWGWNGKNDGYYAFNYLNTDIGDFNTDVDIVTGIRPKALDTDDIESLFVSMDTYTFKWDPTQYYPLQLEVPGGVYYYSTNNDFFGQIYVVFEDLTDGSVIHEMYADITQPDPESGNPAEPMPIGYGWSEFSGWCETELVEGHHYRAYLASKTQGEKGYSPVRIPGGAVAHTLYVDTEGVVSVVGTEFMEVPEIIPTAVKDVRNVEETVNADVTYVYDLQGRLVHRAPTSSFNLWNVPARGVLVIKQGNKTRKVVR